MRSPTQPLDFFQSNQFWPLRDSLAFSDALIGYTPAGLIGSGPHAAVVRYDLLFLLRRSRSRSSARTCWRASSARRAWAAAVARRGVRLRAVAARAGRPPARALERRDPARAVPAAARLAARARRADRRRVRGRAWQMALGFSLGLQLGYLLLAARRARGHLVVARRAAGAPAAPGRRDARRRRPAVAVLASCSRARTCGCSTPTRRPSARRSRVSRYSGPLRMFLAAPETSLVWGGATAGRARHAATPCPSRRCSRASRSCCSRSRASAGAATRGRCASASASAALVLALLSLGFQEHGIGPLPALPPALRGRCPAGRASACPGRLHTLTTLALALLAAGGAARAAAATGARRGAPGGGASLAAALAARRGRRGLGVRHRPRRRGARRLPAPDACRRSPPGSPASARRCCSCRPRREDNRRYLLWSTDGVPAHAQRPHAASIPTFFTDDAARRRVLPGPRLGRAAAADRRAHRRRAHRPPADPRRRPGRRWVSRARAARARLRRERRGPLVDLPPRG